MKGFEIQKTLFGDEIYFNKSNEKKLICSIMHLKDQETLEVTYPFIEKKDVDIPVIANIKLERDRNAHILYHQTAGNQSILNLNEIDTFKELKIGKTPNKIKELLGKGGKRYQEVYSICKSGNRTFYFSIRFDKEHELDPLGNQLPDDFVHFFSISLSLYDPSLIGQEHEVFQPLQMIYAVKLYLKDL